MTLQQSIQTLLDPLATGGAHQDVAIQKTVAPYIVWQEVVSPTKNTLEGASNVQNTRLQIDCFASSPAGRKALVDAVIAAMVAAPFINLQINSQNLYDVDSKLFRSMLEYSIWST